MKISIIIPVYNVEIYLEQCLDSILYQDYHNLEIIIVNDGSTDRSGEICEKYAQNDNRIKLIQQENQGISIARNNGLKAVTGDFINFIDSDDWINQGMYSNIISEINKNPDIDIVYIPYKNTARLKKSEFSGNEIKTSFLPDFIGGKYISLGMHAYVWTLCIRKNLIRNLSFENITMSEDKLFFLQSVIMSNSLVILPQKYYNYRSNPTSITHKHNKNLVEDQIFANKVIRKTLDQYNLLDNKELKKRYTNYILGFLFFIIRNEAKRDYLKIPNKDLSEYFDKEDIGKHLTWRLTIKNIFRQPKWILIKLGYIEEVLSRKWKKAHL